MAVFMKATLVEQAMMDLIICVHETCNSADSEEKQLQSIFSALGKQYDSERAAETGGAPCFSGPEGMALLLSMGLTACNPATCC